MKSEELDAGLAAARAVLAAEAGAIEQVSQNLNGTFTLMVKELCNLSPGGKIILSGMGKAGFIAMKISATLASVGLPSFYLHPAEAIHGDLGRFTKNDIALILSNSGETPEILRLIPHLKRVGCPVLSLTALADSNLALHSDICIAYGKHKEAEPLGVAPTVSTTVMLALGDALVMSLVHQLGITREHFAQLHPGGELGKSLTLVSTVMRSGERHCLVTQEMLVRDVIRAMIATPGRPGAATVVDAQGVLCGILTDGDMRRCLSHGAAFVEKPVAEIMGKHPKTIIHSRLIEEAQRTMREHRVDELIVVNELGRPLGIIDIQDIIALQTS